MVDQSKKSIDDAIFEARAIVNDAVEPFRNTDETVLAYLNTALRVVYGVRPDAYIGDFTQGVTTTTPINTYYATDLDQNPPTPFPLDDRIFFYPVVAYIAGRIELSDDEFTDTSRSQQLLQAFTQQMMGL